MNAKPAYQNTTQKALTANNAQMLYVYNAKTENQTAALNVLSALNKTTQ